MTESAYLILGTAMMVLMMLTIILFVYLFQRKLALKAKEYREIEKLVQQQELQSAYSLIDGQERERKRIASELHDNIGGLLATLKIYSDLTLQKPDTTDINRLNLKINAISEDLSQEVRKLSHELDLRTLSGFGFKVAVQQLCEAIAESGKLDVIQVIDLPRPVHEHIALNLYRIIQELFTNSLKHAEATVIRVELSLIENDITLIYEDNGRGFDTQAVGMGGMGTKNILSRVNVISGKLTLDSSERGTTYIIELTDHE